MHSVHSGPSLPPAGAEQDGRRAGGSGGSAPQPGGGAKFGQRLGNRHVLLQRGLCLGRGEMSRLLGGGESSEVLPFDCGPGLACSAASPCWHALQTANL